MENKQNVKFFLNNDMIAYNANNDNQLWSMPYTKYIGYHNLAKQAINQYTTLIATDGELNIVSSDLLPFYNSQIPSAYFWQMELNSNHYTFYHTSNDILTNFDMNYCTQAVKAGCALMAHISDLPSELKGLNVENVGNGASLFAKWSKLKETNIASYKVTVADSLGTILFNYQTTDTMFKINNLNNSTKYQIGVMAIDSDNDEGIPVYDIATTNLVPLSPTNVILDPEWHKIKLSCHKNIDLDLKGYNIYRKELEQTQFAKIAFITDTVFTDNACLSNIWYQYYVKTIDSTNIESSASQIISGCPVSLNKGLLIVDASIDGSGTLINPDDAMQDAFFNNITSNFPQTANFDANLSGKITLSYLGQFSTVLVHSLSTELGSVFNQNKLEIKKYLDFGGKMLIFADKPGKLIENNNSYPCKFDTSSIAYKYFGLDSSNYIVANRCSGATPFQTGYNYLSVDTAKATATNGEHIKKLETLRPRYGANTVYNYDSQYTNSTTYGSSKGKPIGIENLTSTYKTFVMAMPLYYIKENEAKQLVEYVINERFTTSINDENKNIPDNTAIIGCYPNPFNPTTTIKYFVKNSSKIQISVYNALGEMVTTLFDGKAKSGNHSINFDATGLNSGVYFVKLTNDDNKNQQFVQKILMVK